MTDEIDPSNLDGAPPANFASFDRHVVLSLLGPKPESLKGRPSLAEKPEQWLKNKPGREYFHRGLARLLSERGGTVEAADSIRLDLESGKLRTLVVDTSSGRTDIVEARKWEALEASKYMYWTGFGSVNLLSGPLYIIKDEKNTDLRNSNFPSSEAPITPNVVKSDVLSTKERQTAFKIILAAYYDGYGVVPGKPSTAAAEIAKKTEDLWPGDGVSVRNVRHWIKMALDDLGEPSPGVE